MVLVLRWCLGKGIRPGPLRPDCPLSLIHYYLDIDISILWKELYSISMAGSLTANVNCVGILTFDFERCLNHSLGWGLFPTIFSVWAFTLKCNWKFFLSPYWNLCNSQSYLSVLNPRNCLSQSWELSLPSDSK